MFLKSTRDWSNRKLAAALATDSEKHPESAIGNISLQMYVSIDEFNPDHVNFFNRMWTTFVPQRNTSESYGHQLNKQRTRHICRTTRWARYRPNFSVWFIFWGCVSRKEIQFHFALFVIGHVKYNHHTVKKMFHVLMMKRALRDIFLGNWNWTWIGTK